MPISREEMIAKRDEKVLSALKELAPLWLLNEKYRPHEDALSFNLVYDSPVYGWVSHRYKYDGFNDVLYHLGERRLGEEEVLKVQEQEPYVGGEVATTVPNRPAARPSPPLPKV